MAGRTDRVECEVADCTEDGKPAVQVTCGRCDHQVVSKGQHGAAIRRCFALLREECPEDESNYYTADDERLEG